MYAELVYNELEVTIKNVHDNTLKLFGDPLTMSGGKAIRYSSSVICDLRKLSIGSGDPIGKEEGIKVGFYVRKNHVITNAYPYVKVEYYGIYGKGTDTVLEAIELAIELGIVIKSSAFLKIPDENGDPKVLEDGTKLQWQGLSRFRNYCLENPEFFKDLVNQIESMNDKFDIEQLDESEADEGLDDDLIAQSSND